MNKKQWIILLLGAIVLIGMWFYPPWRWMAKIHMGPDDYIPFSSMALEPTVYHYRFTPPKPPIWYQTSQYTKLKAELDTRRLRKQCIFALLITAGLLLTFMNRFKVMNHKQKVLLWVGIIVSVIMGFHPPRKEISEAYSYMIVTNFFWLIIEWCVVAVITGWGIYVFKDKKDKTR